MPIDPATDAAREQHVQEAIAVLRRAKQFLVFACSEEMGSDEETAEFEFLVCGDGRFVSCAAEYAVKYEVLSIIAPDMMGGQSDE